MQTALHGKIKERRETGGEWLIGANTQNILYLSIVATQYKTRQRRVRCAGAQVRFSVGKGA